MVENYRKNPTVMWALHSNLRVKWVREQTEYNILKKKVLTNRDEEKLWAEYWDKIREENIAWDASAN